jgi:hypothetical protein
MSLKSSNSERARRRLGCSLRQFQLPILTSLGAGALRRAGPRLGGVGDLPHLRDEAVLKAKEDVVLGVIA